MKQTKNQKIVDNARSLIGTKFFYKGRGRGGLDCAGLYVKSIQFLYEGYEFKNYNSNPTLKVIETELLKTCERIDKLEHGCIIVFNNAHIAIYTEEDTIIHTYKFIGKVIEEKLNKFWKDKIYSIFRSN